MATTVGTVQLTGCSYELAYDLLGQDIPNNYSVVRLYGILHVTNNYVSWSSGSASVHTASTGIGTYYGRGDHILITSDFTWSHNNEGAFSAYIGASLSTTWVSGSCGGVITLPTIPRKATTLTAPNFNDETNSIQVTFSNPANFQTRGYINFYVGNQYSTYALRLERAKSLKTSPFTWTFTEQEKQQMRNALNNVSSCNVSIGFDTYSGDTNIGYSSVQRTFSIVNANPIFNDFDIEDTNATTVALTGSTANDVINVNGYSNIKATITASNKAEAQKYATMTKYRLTSGDNSVDIGYSDSASVSGTINGSKTGTYNVYAIDSRNNSTLVTKQASSIINYEKIVFNKQSCNIQRNDNQVGEYVILTLNGTFWNDDFGNTVNSIKSVSYRFKKSDASTWVTGTTTISPTVSGNDFTFSGMIASDNADTTWDLDSSYNVEITISDELSTDTVLLIVNSAIPTLSLDKEGVGVMCAYDRQLGGLLQVGGKIAGQIVLSSTEQIIGKWLGEDLYAKVISVPISTIFGSGTATTGETKQMGHGISNLDTCIFVSVSWTDNIATPYRRRLMPAGYWGTLDWVSNVLVTSTSIQFELGSGVLNRIRTNGQDMYALLIYTKN